MKECKICKKKMTKPKDYSHLQWNESKYCSNKCSGLSRRKRVEKFCLVCNIQMSVKNYEKDRKKVCSKYCKNKLLSINSAGEKNHFFGKRHSTQTKLKIREKKLGKSTEYNKGEKSRFWKGGVSEKNRTIRANIMRTSEYRLWRETVFKRDNWICVLCGNRGKRLNADHIKPFSEFPDLIFSIENGRTLCVECHRKTDTYGVRRHARGSAGLGQRKIPRTDEIPQSPPTADYRV